MCLHNVELDVLILIKPVWCTSHNYRVINPFQHTPLARTFETLNFDQIRRSHVANSKNLQNSLKTPLLAAISQLPWIHFNTGGIDTSLLVSTQLLLEIPTFVLQKTHQLVLGQTTINPTTSVVIFSECVRCEKFYKPTALQ